MRNAIRPALHVGIAAGLIFNAWISYRVLDEWIGLWAAIASVVLFPITNIVLPFVMFFIPSTEAGPLSLWPGVIVVGVFAGLLNKH